MIQGSNTNLLIWKGNVDYRKIALDYATLGRAFRNFFSLQTFSCLFINTMIVKTINSWKPLSREFTYKVINTANIVHPYFSLIALSVHSHSTYVPTPIWMAVAPRALCSSLVFRPFHHSPILTGVQPSIPCPGVCPSPILLLPPSIVVSHPDSWHRCIH